MISLEKLKILTPSQKLPKNVGHLGKLIVANGFKCYPKCNKLPNMVTLLSFAFFYPSHRQTSVKRLRSFRKCETKATRQKCHYYHFAALE